MNIKSKSLVTLSAFAVAGIAFAASTPDVVPCAMMLKAGNGVQIIPPQGAVQTRFQVDQPIVCGSMVISHAEPVWIRHQDQTVFKLGPNSFFEIGKKKTDAHRLYRGQVLVNAPPSIPTMTLTTPNGEVEFKGGVAWIEYSPTEKETAVASFNRTVDFKNKFSADAVQTVNVAEISRLTLNQDRVIPSQPVVMSPSSIKEALQGFDLADDEHEELTQVVQRVFENRAKSLTADIEDWSEIAKAAEAARSIASVPEKKVKKTEVAINPAEAKFSMDLLKKHLYGDDEDMKMLNDESRKPASVQKLDDSEYEKKKKKKKQETQRLIDEVSKIP